MAVTTATGTGGAQVSLKQYRNLVRDYLKDWEYEDRLQADITASETTLSVLDGDKFGSGSLVQLESELVYVTGNTSATITVRRGWHGTTAAAHLSGVPMFRSTTWTDDQLDIWINESFYHTYPYLYTRSSTTLTGSSTSYDYDLSSYITEENQAESVEVHLTADSIPHRTRLAKGHITMRGATPYLYIPLPLSGYTITFTYVEPYPPLDGDNDKTTIPTRAKMLPVYYTAARAMEQRENIRVSFDEYPLAQDERVSREGSQQQTANYYWQLFKSLRYSVKMPWRRYM